MSDKEQKPLLDDKGNQVYLFGFPVMIDVDATQEDLDKAVQSFNQSIALKNFEFIND
jgi:hypothetical protein